MVSLYDEALLKKLNKWTGKSQLNIYGPGDEGRLLEVMADKSGDKPIKLPIISLIRQGGYEITNPNKKRLTYDGLMLDSTTEKSLNLNAIPINITYQLDVMTRYFKEADAYMRNIIFNIVNFPTLPVYIPYNGENIEHYSNIRIITDVLDNSEIRSQTPDQFTRLSIGIGVDDAYIWDVRINDNIAIISDVDFDN